MRHDFLKRNGALVRANERGFSSETFQPVDDGLGIFHAAAKKEHLRFRRRERNAELVIDSALRVAQELIFIDDEELRSAPLEERRFLCFQGGDDDFCLEIFGNVAGRDADVPAAFAPFGELVIGQCAGRDGENGLST